jgi:lichenan operon transcriptional antiterminator
MNSRQFNLLTYLIGEEEPITGQYLAKQIQVTSRTVRNDLKVIDHFLSSESLGASIKSLKGKGYILEVENEQVFNEYLKSCIEEDEQLPIEPEDRVHFLVKKFLLESHFIKIEDLADELYVSRSTLQNDLRDVKVVLDRYNLCLEKRPSYGLKVIGKEKDIREAISDLLFKRVSVSLEHLLPEGWELPLDDVNLIRHIVLEHLRGVKLNLSDIALNNLVVHIAIACHRVKTEQYVTLVNKDRAMIMEKPEFQVAEAIIKDIEQALNINFPSVEISYVAMHLLGTKLFLDQTTLPPKEAFDEQIMETVERMVNLVSKTLDLDIEQDKELKAAVAIHLKPAIHRYKYKMAIRNPMLEAIKTNYPLAFDAGVIASKVIEEHYKIKVDEHEIGYIALHFGAAIERAKMKTKPKRCLIVCTTGLGSAQLLLYKMRAKFGNQLTIVGTTELHRLNEYNSKSIDFIVSTVPLPKDINVPYVVVSTLLGGNELSEIETMIGRERSIIDNYVDESFIDVRLELDTMHDCLWYLSEKLTQKGLVSQGYAVSVLEREAIATTNFGNLVAIPHPLEPHTNKTFWSILTLKEPITWGDSQVQLVCLLNIAKNNKENLEPMYQQLIYLMDNKNIVNQIINARTPRDVIKVMKGALK